MRLIKRFVWLFCILAVALFAQDSTITWTETTGNYSLPAGVKVFKGTRSSPKLQAFYFDVDLNNDQIAVRSYLASSAANLKTLTTRFGALAAVNGGFFYGSSSLSSVIYPGEVMAQNIIALTRNSKSYPVVRSLFSLNKYFEPSVNWIYHFGSTVSGVYQFTQPLAYVSNDPTPKSAPTKSGGTQMTNLLTGIGGAPTLVKNGQRTLTYNEEIMWGSGVGLENGDPRTAVGYTADKHVIIFAADGRQETLSQGVSLIELADILISLGCVEGMNLDGGGSTQMTVGAVYVNSPSEQYRSIPTILAIVNRDSVKLPASEEGVELIIDTEDANCSLIGGGWSPSANDGYYGTSRSMLNTKGTGDKQAIYRTSLNKSILCKVYGWWVASSNRCTDTPYVVVHANGRDTVRVNQTINGSKWNFIGQYNFSSNPSQCVIISNQATTNTYIVADALRLMTADSVEIVTSIDPKTQSHNQIAAY
ncbi:MAG: phosphodiester glycosidase family protein, partial [Candidatus Neomarinimicrobiota bacterium]